MSNDMTWRYQYITRKILAPMLLAAMMFTYTSCDDGDTGPEGPQGEQGTAGDKGDTGDAGTEGEAPLTKTGYFEGTVTGTRQDGTAFTETFKYEYTYDAYEAIQSGEGDWLRLRRYDDAINDNEDSPYIYTYFLVENAGTAQETIEPRQFYFTMEKAVETSKLFRFSAGFDYGDDSDAAAEIVISNYIHDMTTGALSFDFTYTDDYNDTGVYNSTENPVTITGSFNSDTGKVYSTVVNRKGR